MNEKNLDYLKNSLKYLGFGDKLNAVLENGIRLEMPHFKLCLNNSVIPSGVSKEVTQSHDFIRYDLNFSKSKDSDMYFLNNYQATLKKPGIPERDHTFNLSQNNWITAREAYNLLSGRSINKDLTKDGNTEKINIWTKLDLDVKDARGNFPSRYFYPNFGYDLDKAISKYPIKALDDPNKKADLIAALKKGDMVPGEILIQGKKAQIFIAANPEMKGVDLYDKKFQVIRDYDIWPELSKEKKQTTTATESSAVTENKVANNKSSKVTQEQSGKPWDQNNSEEKSKTVGR